MSAGVAVALVSAVAASTAASVPRSADVRIDNASAGMPAVGVKQFDHGAWMGVGGLSFSPEAHGGRGILLLRNTGRARQVVSVDPVAAETASNLGISYSLRGDSVGRSSSTWISLSKNTVVLEGGESARVRVKVVPPPRAAPGDYVAGISIQRIDEEALTAGAPVRQVFRQVVRVLTRVAGPARARFDVGEATNAASPAGIRLGLVLSNGGRRLVSGLTGKISVSVGSRTIKEMDVGPSDVVPHTRVEYPIPTDQAPPAGTVFRVRGEFSWDGRTVRFDRLTALDAAQAALQEREFGGPPPGRGSSWWLGPAFGVFLALGLLSGSLMCLRRIVVRVRVKPLRSGRGLALLESALGLLDERAGNVSAIVVELVPPGDSRLSAAIAAVRTGLRRSDILAHYDGRWFFVVAPDTPEASAERIALALRDAAGAVSGVESRTGWATTAVPVAAEDLLQGAFDRAGAVV